MANIGDYASTYAGFAWETSEWFDFGRDVVDRRAAQDRPAMIWLGANGEEAKSGLRPVLRLLQQVRRGGPGLGHRTRRQGDDPARQGSGVLDEDRGTVVKAYAVVGKDYEPSDSLAREVQEYCKEHTAPYKYPPQIEFIAELPKTTSGKIRRVELRKRETADAS